jgi:hypothetical protein
VEAEHVARVLAGLNECARRTPSVVPAA